MSRSEPYRFLFVPVSAPRGTGEYARCLAIADAILGSWPGSRIKFAVSREAPYARSVPYEKLELDRSPTFHVRELQILLREFRPDLVYFDNAGRTAQLRTAKEVGARTVYISSRKNRRRRAFRPHWLRLLDEHWIAYPQFMAGDLNLLERVLLRIAGGPKVRFLATLMPYRDPGFIAATRDRYGLRVGEYVLVAPGGGLGHRTMAAAPAVIGAAAARLAEQGIRTVVVGSTVPAGGTQPTSLLHLPSLAMAELIALIEGARLVISNGADTLLQVMACDCPCVAVPMSPDQIERLRRLREAGVPIGVELDENAIVAAASRMLSDDTWRQDLRLRVRALGLRNDMDVVMQSTASLLAHSGAHR